MGALQLVLQTGNVGRVVVHYFAIFGWIFIPAVIIKLLINSRTTKIWRWSPLTFGTGLFLLVATLGTVGSAHRRYGRLGPRDLGF